MTRTAGIKFDKTPAGKIKSVTIDFKRYEQKLRPFLEDLGAVEEDAFEKKWKNGLTGDQLRAEMNKRIAIMFQTPPTGK